MTTIQIKRLIIEYQTKLVQCTDDVYTIGSLKGKIKLLINMYNTSPNN